jgi:heme/copper-type cytochrome/quinol oxidase subunit 2
VLAAGVAAVVVLFVVLRPGDDADPGPSSPSTSSVTPTPPDTASPEPGAEPTEEPTTTPTPDAHEIEIEVEEGRVDGPSEVRVERGERIRLVVEADVADEVHLHGYDLMADVAPGSPAVIVFRADAPGVFEVELEDAGLLLFQLRVQA